MPTTFRRAGWGAACLAACLLALPAGATIVERVVAVVGENPILLTDVQERARPILVTVFEQVPDGPQRTAAVSRVYKAVLERMVDEELEDAAAARAGIVVSTAEIDEALERVAQQNGLTPGTILAEAKRSGLTPTQYREELRRQVLQAKLGGLRLQGRIQVTEADLLAAYARLVREERLQLPQRTARIAIPVGSSPAEETEAKRIADQISEQARAGEDFQVLLRRYGKGPSSGVSPSAPPLQEPPEIQRASLALDVGETSRPIRLGGELIVLQVIERSPTTLPAYAEAAPALQERVYMEKMGVARQRWLEGLRRRTHVELRM